MAELDRLPPQDLAAEKSVLGSMLHEPAAVGKAVELLQDWCFYQTGHQHIFNAMTVMFEKNEPIDMLTLAAQLKKMQKLDDVGGAYYIAELSAGVSSAANVEYHARIVLEKALARRLLGTAYEIITETYSETESIHTVMDRAEQKIFFLAEHGLRRGFESLPPALHRAFEQIEAYHKSGGGVTGVPTGYKDLDEMTSGLQPSDLVIIAGRPSMGKTAFALNIASYAALQAQTGVGIFSLEMSTTQIALRLLCSAARVDSHKVRSGRLAKSDFAKIAQTVGKIAEAPIYIDDTPAMTSSEIRAKARRLAAEKKVGLIVVDYLQLVRWPGKTENRVVEITFISQSMKALAKELNIPVIVLSQLSRAVETRGGDKRPQLSDLRESGAIEQDADVVMFIYRPDVYSKELASNTAEIIVGKQRNGPIGTVDLVFLKDFTTFVNAAPVENPAGLPF